MGWQPGVWTPDKKGVDADQAGIGYRTISKEFERHQSAVKQTAYRWTKFKNSRRQSSVQEQKW